MKSWITGILIATIILAALYCFAYFMVIPQVAKAMMPGKWESVVLNQKENDFIDYLGKPANGKVDEDTWFIRKNKYQYTLTVEYDHSDSLAKKYIIIYNFKNWLFKKSGVLKGDSTLQKNYTDSL